MTFTFTELAHVQVDRVHGCICLLSRPYPPGAFLFICLDLELVSPAFPGLPWLLAPFSPAWLTSPSFKLPVDLIRVPPWWMTGCVLCVYFCFNYWSVILNSESQEVREHILFMIHQYSSRVGTVDFQFC